MPTFTLKAAIRLAWLQTAAVCLFMKPVSEFADTVDAELVTVFRSGLRGMAAGFGLFLGMAVVAILTGFGQWVDGLALLGCIGLGGICGAAWAEMMVVPN